MSTFLYQTQHKINTTLSSSPFSTTNLPLSDGKFIVYRLAQTEILFVVKDQDRKPVNLSGRQIMIHISSGDTGYGLLERELVVVDPTKGHAKLILTPLDTISWQIGTHHYSISVINDSGYPELLYINESFGAIGDFSLSPSAIIEGIETIEITEFTPSSNILYLPIYISSAVPGSSLSTYLHTNHTFAMYFDNFTGEVWMEGAITNTIPNDEDWFVVDIDDQTKITHEMMTGIDAYSVDACLMWVRFAFTKTSGELSKILYRC